jgi:hypothetical protein
MCTEELSPEFVSLSQQGWCCKNLTNRERAKYSMLTFSVSVRVKTSLINSAAGGQPGNVKRQAKPAVFTVGRSPDTAEIYQPWE